MQLPLDKLAEISTALDLAEGALAEGAIISAHEQATIAETVLQSVRDGFKELSPAQQAAITPLAKPLSQRLAAVQSQLPVIKAVAAGSVEEDPEQDEDPEESSQN